MVFLVRGEDLGEGVFPVVHVRRAGAADSGALFSNLRADLIACGRQPIVVWIRLIRQCVSGCGEPRQVRRKPEVADAIGLQDEASFWPEPPHEEPELEDHVVARCLLLSIANADDIVGREDEQPEIGIRQDRQKRLQRVTGQSKDAFVPDPDIGDFVQFFPGRTRDMQMGRRGPDEEHWLSHISPLLIREPRRACPGSDLLPYRFWTIRSAVSFWTISFFQ
jgi:hypothetical protein